MAAALSSNNNFVANAIRDVWSSSLQRVALLLPFADASTLLALKQILYTGETLIHEEETLEKLREILRILDLKNISMEKKVVQPNSTQRKRKSNLKWRLKLLYFLKHFNK